MDHNAILLLVTGGLGALALFANRVWGEPKERMAHQEALEAMEAKAAALREKAQTRLVEAWERRAADLEERLNRQDARQALLESANAALRSRVEVLEQQLREAGLLHTADLATIANLRHELEQAREELAAAREEIAELLARVGELDALLHKRTDSTKAVATKKKGAKK